MDKEREIAIQEAKQELYELLEKEGPKDKHQCTVFESSNGKFFLVTGGKTGTGHMMYVINSHLWYDHDIEYMETRPWKVIYKKLG